MRKNTRSTTATSRARLLSHASVGSGDAKLTAGVLQKPACSRKTGECGVYSLPRQSDLDTAYSGSLGCFFRRGRCSQIPKEHPRLFHWLDLQFLPKQPLTRRVLVECGRAVAESKMTAHQCSMYMLLQRIKVQQSPTVGDGLLPRFSGYGGSQE